MKAGLYFCQHEGRARPCAILPSQFGPTLSNLRIELLRNDNLALSFPYDAELVAKLRILSRRKWNAKLKRWEVHLSHLPELMRIFGLAEGDFPPNALKRHRERYADGMLRVQLGSLSGELIGARAPVTLIDAATSFPMPGHRFSLKFQSGQWDGRRHLFSAQTMKFPSGLWPRVRKVLEDSKTPFELREDAPPEGLAATYGPPQSALRPYQEAALEKALTAGRGIVQIATGGGKTLLAAHLIRRAGMKAFFFVHTRDLLHQTHAVMERELGVTVGRLGDGLVELADLTIATIQTAAKAFAAGGGGGGRRPAAEEREEAPDAAERPTRLGPRKAEIARAISEAGLVVFDECHHVPAETFYKIAFKASGARHRFGLSATPWRDDGHDLLLEAALGEKICAVDCSSLIDSGYLVPPHIVMERAPLPVGLRRRAAYPDLYRAAIVENRERNRAIAAQATRWAAEGIPTLILVAHVEHGRRLMELLPEAQFAHGQVESETRRRFVDELERKLRPILIATTLADEGLDIPVLEALILAGGGKSATKAYQRVGRALRTTPGKRRALIMDFFDPVPYLEEHSLARLALYRAEPRFEVETKGFRA